MERKLGVDIGGVIIGRGDESDDTSFFSDNFLRTPEIFGALHSLSHIAQKLGSESIHLVSKCGKATEEKTLEWLEHHKFYALTNIKPDHVHFCRKRQDKAIICRDLGLTMFVDDRLEILSYLDWMDSRFLLNPTDEEVAQYASFLPGVIKVDTWSDIDILLV